ncbi:type II toxin-antitoxin system RelE/ParE family toxin [Flavobacterium rakeshii]|uniref:Type II toxin-antitoxin system RelE/ParE family toxin n=1 Tax=Flavobacterium rakeshii TaxID=1038845 RepID=A0A6N8HHL4_9FLAO|nr:type II toxin-antitoxin system RelE/ParE family toxin [Flavobacterium rakeshii]MUV05232.1 type II toxin-antitoxin system RelE/ParE family toxin [Flavobacterium rakeshii]
MAYTIIWSDFAETELDKIFTYYCENAGIDVAKKILAKIITEPEKLLKSPEIGQLEELLLNRDNDYRYLICDNYKIIYSVDEKNQLIKVADVFDTRQDSFKLKRTK